VNIRKSGCFNSSLIGHRTWARFLKSSQLQGLIIGHNLMWVKERAARNKLSSRAVMGPVAQYEELLEKAASGNGAQNVPNAAVIAADATGE
jgi:hypothetical protein